MKGFRHVTEPEIIEAVTERIKSDFMIFESFVFSSIKLLEHLETGSLWITTLDENGERINNYILEGAMKQLAQNVHLVKV